VRAIRRQGYKVDWKQLRACDYGAPTIRKRLFLIARCDGLPISWPAATHGQGLKPYKTAADIIDWSLPCPSIFERKRPLAEKTLDRIAEGLRRYVFETNTPFIVDTAAASFITEHANGSSQRNFDCKNHSEPNAQT
jgi:Site-specific DNA methylase